MWRDRIGVAVALAVLAVATFAIGGAPRWAACLVAVLGLASAAPFVTSRRALPGGSPLLIFLGIAAGATLLQLIPFPEWFAGLASPAKQQLLIDNARALGEEPSSFFAISMDPPATAVELAKLLGYLAFAYTCLRLSASRQWRRWLVIGLVATGAAIAASALIHNIVGARELFGLYSPRYMPPPRYMTPLLNLNHLAGLMALLTPIAVGLALALAPRYRPLPLAAALAMGGLALLTTSRGGGLALALGLGTTAVLLVLHHRRGSSTVRKQPLSVMLPIGVVALCALVLLGVLTAGPAAERLLGSNTAELGEPASKFGAWRSATTLLRDHTWAGVGRGAFEPSFTRVHDPGTTIIYSHLENEYLQTAVDWGIPAAAALAIAFVWIGLGAGRRSRRGHVEAGLFGGLVAIAAQNIVDFSLSLPGVAIPTIAAIALLIGPDIKLRRITASKRVQVIARAGVGLFACAVVALAASPYARAARVETNAVQRAIGNGRNEVAAAVRVFQRHPSDYMAAGVLARALYEQRDPRAVVAINRALALNPYHPGLHLLAARMLYDSQRPEQALVEYSLALERSYRVRSILLEMKRRFPEPERMLRGLPLTPGSLAPTGRQLLVVGAPELVLAYGQRFTERHPRSAAAHRYVADAARALNRHDLAIDAARRAMELEPDAASATALADAMVAAGRAQQVRGTLQDHLKLGLSSADRLLLLRSLARAEEAAGSPEAARAPLREALRFTGGDRRTAAALHRELARIEASLGNTHQAGWERSRAKQLLEK